MRGIGHAVLGGGSFALALFVVLSWLQFQLDSFTLSNLMSRCTVLVVAVLLTGLFVIGLRRRGASWWLCVFFIMGGINIAGAVLINFSFAPWFFLIGMIAFISTFHEIGLLLEEPESGLSAM